MTHWKRPWCWERLKTKGEGGEKDETVGWHHWLNGHEVEQTLGDSAGQGSLACCRPWGQKNRTRLSNETTTTGIDVSHQLLWGMVSESVDFPPCSIFNSSEKAMATHSSTLAWKIPWAEEPGRLPSMGSHRVGNDWSDLAAAYLIHRA